MRSNDQFNTTIYGYSDRLARHRGHARGAADQSGRDPRRGLERGPDRDARQRRRGWRLRESGLKVTPFDLPDGCIGGYYPEMNALISLWYHDQARA